MWASTQCKTLADFCHKSNSLDCKIFLIIAHTLYRLPRGSIYYAMGYALSQIAYLFFPQN